MFLRVTPAAGRALRILITATVCCLWLAAEAAATTYYVRKSGNDLNTGRTPNQAFKTINRAAISVRAGDTVYVGGGTYEESILMRRSGSSGRPVRFVADTKGQQTGDVGAVVVGYRNSFAMVVYGASDNELDGFTFRPVNGNHYGIVAQGSDDLVLNNCTFQNTYYGAIVVDGDATISNCRFTDVTYYPVLGAIGDLLVDNCDITGAGMYAVYHVTNDTRNPHSLHIRKSRLTDNYAGPFSAYSQMTLEQNEIRDNQYWGAVSAYGELTFNKQPGISGNGYGLYVAGNGLSNKRSFRNLDFSNNQAYGLYAVYCDLELRNCKLENNQNWALALVYSSLSIRDTPIQNNGNAMLVYSNRLTAKPEFDRLEISNNSGIGLYHYTDPNLPATLELQRCNIRNNGSWGLLNYHGQVECRSSDFLQNRHGVYLYRDNTSRGSATHRFQRVNIEDVAEEPALYSTLADLRLDQCQLRRCASYGVQCYYGDFTAEDSIFSDLGTSSGYAVYHYDAGPVNRRSPTMELENCEFTGNYAGPYGHNTHMTVDDCRIENNRYWALSCAYGDLNIRRRQRTITKNGYGLYVAGNNRGGVRHLKDWDFSGNGNYGVFASDCNLQLEDCKIERMTGWGLGLLNATLTADNSPIRNNGQGVQITSQRGGAAPALTNVEVSDNAGIGVYHSTDRQQPLRLTLQNCTIQRHTGHPLVNYYGDVHCRATLITDNEFGVLLTRDVNDAGIGAHEFSDTIIRNVAKWHCLSSRDATLTLDRCRFENAYNSGVMSYFADITARDCVFQGLGTGTGYALYHVDDKPQLQDRARMHLRGCQITGNYGGPYANRTRLTVDNCTIENNTYWAIVCDYGDFEFQNQAKAIRNNGYGLYVSGNVANNERRLRGFEISNNGNYGIYAAYCNLVLEDCVLENMTDWAAAVEYGSLQTTNTPIRNSGNGVIIYTSAQHNPDAQFSDLYVHNNSGIGLYHYSQPNAPTRAVFQRCQVNNNGGYALQSVYGDVSCNNSVFDGNQQGLNLTRDLQFGGRGNHQLLDTVIRNTQAGHGVYSTHATLQLTRCRLENNRDYGALSYFADLTAEDCVFQGQAQGYAAYCEDNQADRSQWARLTLRNSQVTGNYAGPYVQQAHLTLDNCTIEGNTNWGVVCSYGDLLFSNMAQAINNNGSGLFVAGNNTPEGRVLSDFDVSANGNYGVYASDCNLVLNNCKVQDMTGWGIGLLNATLRTNNTPIINNGNGIHITSQGSVRNPDLTGIFVGNSGGYGVYHTSASDDPATLTMRQCRVENYGSYGLVNMYGNAVVTDSLFRGDPSASQNGVYLYQSPQSQIERVSVLNHREWGLLSYGSNVVVRNSVVANNAYGAYLYNYSGENTRATIWNSTLGNNSVYGVVQTNGSSSLINNIINSDSQGAQGLTVRRGNMHHAYNLISGYSQPHSGTNLAEGEVIGAPRFTDPASGDFTLRGSSMAINRGAEMPGRVDYDMLGFRRPQFGKWEIGAYEYTQPTSSAHIVEWQETK